MPPSYLAETLAAPGWRQGFPGREPAERKSGRLRGFLA